MNASRGPVAVRPTTFFQMPDAERMDYLESIGDQVARIRSGDARVLEESLVVILSRDDHPVIRHEAAFLLGILRDTGLIAGRRAMAALCDSALNDTSTVVRHECAEALVAFDGVGVDSVLRHLLSDADADVARTAALTLDRIRLRQK